MVIVIVVVIEPNMGAGANIPFQTLGISKISMYFIQSSKAKTVIPEIANEFTGMIPGKKMLE